MRSATLALVLVLAASPLAAQVIPQSPAEPPAPKSPFDGSDAERFKQYLGTGGLNRRPKTPATHFLPAGNDRTSDAGVERVYKKGPDSKPLRPQPDGYPRRIDPATFKPAADEFTRLHEGFDLSSRDAQGKKGPIDFKAGVYGRVVAVESGAGWGRIAVEVDDRGNRVEFLHTSKGYVKPGDTVTPDTVLGMTGKVGAADYHLHVQARNKDSNAINPDEVVTYARKPPADRKTAEFFVPMKPRPGVVPFTADPPPGPLP